VDYDFLSEFVSENFGKDPNFTKDERGRRVRATTLMTDEESAAYHARWRENYLGLLARIATLLDSNPQYMDELANTLQDTANQIGKRVVVERHTNDKAGWPRNKAWVEVKATFDGPAKDNLAAFNGWLERGIKEALNRVESNPLPQHSDRDGRMGNPAAAREGLALLKKGDTVRMLSGECVVESKRTDKKYHVLAAGEGGLQLITPRDENTPSVLRVPFTITKVGTLSDFPWVARVMEWYGQGHYPVIGVRDASGYGAALVGFRDDEGNGAAPIVVKPYYG
jgi:hypothetical protein